MCASMIINETLITDSKGMVSGIPYHDSLISELNIADDMARVVLSKEGALLHIYLEPVIDFSITDAWYRPIVANIRQWPLNDAPWIDGDECFGLQHLYGKRGSHADAKVMCSRILNKFDKPILVQIDCSYGGVMSFVCVSLKGATLK